MSVRPYRDIHRRKSRQISVGGVAVGGDAPITVQSMTNTLTSDAAATIKQIRDLEIAGADIVRVSCPDEDSTAALKHILPEVTVPIVAELEARAGRTVAPAAVYVTLRRLERRGLLESRFEPREGGGRPRRIFRIQPEGIEILRHSKRLLEGLWSGVAALEES